MSAGCQREPGQLDLRHRSGDSERVIQVVDLSPLIATLVAIVIYALLLKAALSWYRRGARANTSSSVGRDRRKGGLARSERLPLFGLGLGAFAARVWGYPDYGDEVVIAGVAVASFCVPLYLAHRYKSDALAADVLSARQAVDRPVGGHGQACRDAHLAAAAQWLLGPCGGGGGHRAGGALRRSRDRATRRPVDRSGPGLGGLRGGRLAACTDGRRVCSWHSPRH